MMMHTDKTKEKDLVGWCSVLICPEMMHRLGINGERKSQGNHLTQVQLGECPLKQRVIQVCARTCAHVSSGGDVQGGPEKNAQNLMHYNFSTAGHRVTRFPSKCAETNW